jgi:hypothetical protein
VSQAVQLPHHHRVARANVLRECGQPWTVIASAGHGVGERLRNTGRLKSGILLNQCLSDGAHPRVSDPLTRWMCIRLHARVFHKGQNAVFETDISETNF